MCIQDGQKQQRLEIREIWTFNALKEVRERFPFPIKGIDSDNGSEFINAHLLNYCEKEYNTKKGKTIQEE